ncbi:MAG: 16S rRNA (cytosine(967)-C(5))-methyltransferase RsmB, partial [Holdemanella sp.]|nr:16S rRNA (cytosine(967)-C(5))-methyltransferase RsmB [Holdemanella sp.]
MRKWVYHALYEVIYNGIYSNLYLKNHLQEVNEKDRALATTIFYGTLQNYSYLQYVYKQYALKKVNKKMDVLLCMSIYQILFLDKIPDYAIINEANNIAKKEKSSGFVNAILRKVKKEAIVLPEDELERASVLYSMPLWLLRMWKAQYGKEKAISMASYSNQSMPLFVRVKDESILDSNFKHVYKKLYIYDGNTISSLDMYKQGKLSVQDEGSYRIVDYLDIKKDLDVLDCCAAPGTKTMAIAEMMDNTGHIDCLDLHEHRVKLIENDIQRLGFTNVYPKCMDATDLASFGLYDRILCDVPCSGYGVLSRKPDIKIRMKPEDMDTLIPLQKMILNSASE